MKRAQTLAATALSLLGALALYLHGKSFDFLCDDAFITLRYAKNLAERGMPVYNLSERVEGYTNFLWMLLSAVGYRFGASPTSIVTTLGALASIVLCGSIVWAWSRLRALPLAAAIVPLALCASSASLAAWTMSGLETGLYSALLFLGTALTVRVVTAPSRREVLAWGLVFALTTLTRPEGVAFMGIGALFVLAARRTKDSVRDVALASAAFALVIVPYFLWRKSYYGDWLPNTFYVKTSGHRAEAFKRGGTYLWLAAKDFGWPGAVLLALNFVPTAGRREGEDDESYRSRVAWPWLLRLCVAFMGVYIASVGGDFLGLWRFVVPAVAPLAFGASLGAASIALRLPKKMQLVPALAIAAVAVVFAVKQHALGVFVMSETDPEERDAALEPIHWTRLYAKRWGAVGRWIAERSQPQDWMAVGAAGAMPYYAGISSLDLFGLTDREVARHGHIMGTRPGHQRRADVEYVLSKRPVFLFEGDWDSDTRIEALPSNAGWESRGYVWVEARMTAERHQAPRQFFHYFLMRRDRAETLRYDSHTRVNLPWNPARP